MAYRVLVTDQDLVPIAATVTYTDINGAVLGKHGISVEGSNLDESLISRSSGLTFSAEGYYDFDSPVSNVTDYNDVSLQKKPASSLLHYGIGAAIGFVVAKLLKF